jgi:DNA-binding NarL/FixJ family response regulator
VLKVLIVEDSLDIQRRLQEMLLGLGDVTVVGCAEDVAQAIALADAARPDVALLDISLRDGHSSVPLLRHLRHAHPGTRVAMLSNFGWGAMRASCLNEGAVAFFDKALEFRAARDWVAAQAAQAARPN